MKQKICVVLAMLLAIMMFSVTASAKSVNFTGQVQGDTKAISLLVTKSGADIHRLNPLDIVYINQAMVSEDGTFTLKMPLLSGDFETHTNADHYAMEEVPKKTVYLSANGNDENDGFSLGAPKKTFASVYRMLDEVAEIVLVSDMSLSVPQTEYEGTLIIKGNTGTEKLSVSGLNIKGNLKLDNLVFHGTNNGSDGVSCYIFANGYSLEMGANLTSTGRLTVYGGKSGESVESTDLKLYGGQYKGIYAGGYNGAVTGDTHVIVGGNVNPDDGVDDSNKNTLSPTYVYGGCYNATVGGKTNVTITGNATVNTVVGAGNGANGTAKDTNVNIEGGRVMNVYGGALSGGAALTDCDTHITMTNGCVEGIFGGSLDQSMSGSTNIKIYGGEVTRRIYGGCNLDNANGKYVNGTTVVELYPEAQLCTGNGLSWLNKLDLGIYAGSRNNSNTNEKNYLVFCDDCYDAKKSSVKKAATYMLNILGDGDFLFTDTYGVINLPSEMGRGALVNDVRHIAGDVQLSNGINQIEFDGINEATAQKQQNVVTGNVTVDVDESYLMMAAVYEADTNRMVGIQIADTAFGEESFDLDVSCAFVHGKQYLVKLFVWNNLESLTALNMQYIINLK